MFIVSLFFFWEGIFAGFFFLLISGFLMFIGFFVVGDIMVIEFLWLVDNTFGFFIDWEYFRVELGLIIFVFLVFFLGLV